MNSELKMLNSERIPNVYHRHFTSLISYSVFLCCFKLDGNSLFLFTTTSFKSSFPHLKRVSYSLHSDTLDKIYQR